MGRRTLLRGSAAPLFAGSAAVAELHGDGRGGTRGHAGKSDAEADAGGVDVDLGRVGRVVVEDVPCGDRGVDRRISVDGQVEHAVRGDGRDLVARGRGAGQGDAGEGRAEQDRVAGGDAVADVQLENFTLVVQFVCRNWSLPP